MKNLCKILIAFCCSLFTPILRAEPKIEFDPLGEGKYSLGLVTVDANTQSLRFPATINMTEGLLEYAIINQKGKIHESLLSTLARPLHIHLGLKLIHFKESRELLEIWDEDQIPTGKFPDVPEEIRKAARAAITIEWTEKGKKHHHSLNSLIYHLPLERPMSESPWIFHGSYLFKGKLKAETTGDFLAIYLSRPALFNFSGEDRHLDDVWIPNKKLTPTAGTEVTVLISHWPELLDNK